MMDVDDQIKAMMLPKEAKQAAKLMEQHADQLRKIASKLEHDAAALREAAE